LVHEPILRRLSQAEDERRTRSGLKRMLRASGPRRLGLWSATALVIANMIGAGIFTTSGFALADLGSPAPVLLAWLVGGLFATCGALCYGALARRIPISGGEYTFLSRTIHPLAGFLAGWVSLLAGFTAPIAVAALGLQAYLADAVGGSFPREWIGTSVILAAGLMHGLRVGAGVALQNAAVALKLLLIVIFLGIGVSRIDTAAMGPTSSPTAGFELTAFAMTLIWVSFAYSGWNAAVYVAGEIEHPERNLPRSLLLATGATTLLYLALNAVFLYSAPATELAGKAEIGAVAAQALGGDGLRRLVSGLVALALFTSISSMIMAGPRVYAQMAEDGLLPKRFAMQGAVPATAVAAQVLLAIVVVWVAGLATLLGYVGFTLNLCAAATVAGLLRLRRREGAVHVPIVGYPWAPGIFLILSLGATSLMAVRDPRIAAAGILTGAVGVPIYYWLGRVRG
jgi:APA family basic amino acid/polyamine antiporter